MNYASNVERSVYWRTYLSTHSVLGIHSLLLVHLLTGYASPRDDRTTLDSQREVAGTNKLEKILDYIMFDWKGTMCILLPHTRSRGTQNSLGFQGSCCGWGIQLNRFQVLLDHWALGRQTASTWYGNSERKDAFVTLLVPPQSRTHSLAKGSFSQLGRKDKIHFNFCIWMAWKCLAFTLLCL